MAFDRNKIIAEGGTYHGADNPLIECAPFTVGKVTWASVADTGLAPTAIKEDANLPKRMMIEGVFQRADKRNANQRVYPRSLWDRLLSEAGPVMKRIAEKAMIGHLEHPTEGTTDLNKGAIRIEKVWMESDGTIYGRALVFNTPEGQRIQEYVTTGTKIGISSRGTGTVDAKGCVCEDFQLETWDMVYNPSTPGAHPGLANESTTELTVQNQVVEAIPHPDTITTQDKPMSLSKRIAEARTSVSNLLAIDPKRLTEDGRATLSNDLLDARVKIAESFTGEQRVAEVLKLIESLEVARKACEDFDGGYKDSPVGDAAPEGQVKTGIPGTWDSLDKLVAGAGEAKAKTIEAFNSMAAQIAANMGKLPQIQAAVESAIKGVDPVAESAKLEDMKSLLRDARDEILTMTEGREAATAIIDELTARVSSLHGEMAEGKVREDKATKIIAELTSATAGKKTEEAKKPEETPAAKVEEAKAPEAPTVKTLAERIAEKAKSAKVDESALPTPGQKVESKKDAGDVAAKNDVSESISPRAATVLAGLKGALKQVHESVNL